MDIRCTSISPGRRAVTRRIRVTERRPPPGDSTGGQQGHEYLSNRAGQSTATRPVILGVVGDSAAGKTTLTRGLVRALGEGAVAHSSTDDYHKFDRRRRAELGITPLHPDCNYIDIMAQHLSLVRAGEPRPQQGLLHPDFSPLLDADVEISLEDAVQAQVLRIPGHIPRERAAAPWAGPGR